MIFKFLQQSHMMHLNFKDAYGTAIVVYTMTTKELCIRYRLEEGSKITILYSPEKPQCGYLLYNDPKTYKQLANNKNIKLI